MAHSPSYERSTTATRLDQLPAPVREAANAHADARQLTLGPDTPAWLTHNRQIQRKRGLLSRLTGPNDPDAEHLVAAVVGSRDVLVVTHGEERGTHVLSARLDEVDVARLGEQFARAGFAVPDEPGVSLTGFPVSGPDGGSRGSYFVGLGPPDGDRAEAALREAVRDAKAR